MNAEKLSRRDEIARTLADQMSQGVAPWKRPWTAETRRPHNPISGAEYRGENWFWLTLCGGGAWATFNQIVAAGGTVKKGAKGQAIFFWQPTDPKTADGAKPPDAKAEPLKRGLIQKTYIVFNIEADTEGLDLAKLCPPELVRSEVERHAHAEAIIETWAATLKGGLTFGGDRAYYSPSSDSVRLPVQARFASDGEYYATAFHEFAHATAPRMKRKVGTLTDPKAYAFEELVAELAAAYLCAEVGIDGQVQHAEYLSSWSKMLASDPSAFQKAASAAQKAADLVLSAEAATMQEAA